jgi:ribosomal protein S6--L-glutamate ligase
MACQTVEPVKGFSPTQIEQLKLEIKKAVRDSSPYQQSSVDQPVNTQAKTPKDVKKKLVQKKVKKEALKKIVIGRVEWIGTLSPQIEFRARIDTGAQSCSMHAENVVEKEIDGDRYVEFTTLDEEGKSFTFLKKVVKTSMVKGTSGVAEKRYVVKMQLSFGKKQPLVNVNLNDRRNLKHRFLVGRNLLLRDYIVDVTQSRLLGGKE